MLKTDLIDPVIKSALKEDVGRSDITSSAIIPRDYPVKADLEAKAKGVLCGVAVAERVFRLVDPGLRFLPVAKDGELLEPGREIAYIEGSGHSILIGERTALNFLSHLSGIATLTQRYVEKVKDTRAAILDTRKTTPGLRALEKYAVATGGGLNHRFGLYDQAMIKDNHLRILRKRALVDIVEGVRKKVLKKTIVGIEVKNLKELAEALKSQANYILLDNLPVETVSEAVAMRKKAGVKIDFEVSGGIDLENVLEYAETGVERISVGRLTHAAPSLDISLNIVS